jgi:hypothetical protein
MMENWFGMLGVLLGLSASAATAASDVLYRMTFDPTEQAATWELHGDAAVTDTGRTGKSLHITTWGKDAAGTYALSPAMDNNQSAYTAKFWVAPNIILAQDPGYGAVVLVMWLDADGKEIGKERVQTVTMRPREEGYHSRDFEPHALRWEFHSASFPAHKAAKKFRLGFSWSSYVSAAHAIANVVGEAWLDDLQLVAGGAVNTTPEEKAAVYVDPERVFWLDGAPLNGFTMKDRLGFSMTYVVSKWYDLAVRQPEKLAKDDKAGREALAKQAQEFVAALPKLDPAKVKIRYSIRDFEYNVLAQGEVTPEFWQAEACGGAGFVLPESVKEFKDQWLALSAEWIYDGKSWGALERPFSVVDPVPPAKPLDAMKAHFINFKRPTAHYEQIAYDQWDNSWAWRQPTRESPITFGRDKNDNTFKDPVPFEKRRAGMCMFHYTQGFGGPKWSVTGGGTTCDPEAYGKYVGEFARHSDLLTYAIVSPEGVDCDNPQIEAMAVAAAKAIKAVDPRLKVIAKFDYNAHRIANWKHLDLIDGVVADDYTSTSFTSAGAIKQAVAKKGKPDFEVWLCETGYTGSRDSRERLRHCITQPAGTIQDGVSKLMWFEWCVAGLQSDIRGENLEKTMDYVQCFLVKRPELDGHAGALSLDGNGVWTGPWRTQVRTATGAPITVGGGWSLYMTLERVGIYNCTKELQFGNPAGRFSPLEGVQVELFHHALEKTTIAVLWRNNVNPPTLAWVDTRGKEAVHMDMYGVRETLRPISRKGILVTLSQDPIILKLSGKIKPEDLKFVEVPGGLPDSALVRSQGGTLEVPAPAGDKACFKLGSNFLAGRTNIVDVSGGIAKITAAVPAELPDGDYRFKALLRDGKKTFGVCEARYSVSPGMKLEVDTVPYVKGGKAAVVATVVNMTPVEQKVELRHGSSVTTNIEPRLYTATLTVPAKSSAQQRFELDDVPNPHRQYALTVDAQAASGIKLSQTEALGFRAVRKAAQPIVADGKTDDWSLDELTPILFSHDWKVPSRDYTPANSPWGGPKDLMGKIYFRWDEKNLYFLEIVEDSSFVHKGLEGGIWGSDCTHMRIYPAKLRSGQAASLMPYREHHGIDENGKLVIDRGVDACAGAVPKIKKEGSSTWPEGVEMAIREEGHTQITEIVYPKASLYPLELRDGSEFRSTVMYMDTDREDDLDGGGDGKRWKAYKAAGFGFQWTNVEGNPFGEYEFKLAE